MADRGQLAVLVARWRDAEGSQAGPAAAVPAAVGRRWGHSGDSPCARNASASRSPLRRGHRARDPSGDGARRRARRATGRRAGAPVEDRGIGGAEAPRRIDYDEVPQRRPSALDERPPRVTVVYDPPTERPRRGLREEMAERDAAARRAGHSVARVGGKRRIDAGRFDLHDSVAAIVAMEILGRSALGRCLTAARDPWSGARAHVHGV